jgi:hypothetical protein
MWEFFKNIFFDRDLESNLANLKSESPSSRMSGLLWLGNHGKVAISEKPWKMEELLSGIKTILFNEDEDIRISRIALQLVLRIDDPSACALVDDAIIDYAKRHYKYFAASGKLWEGGRLDDHKARKNTWKALERTMQGDRDRQRYFNASCTLHDTRFFIRDHLEEIGPLQSVSAITLTLVRELIDSATSIGDRGRAYRTLEAINPEALKVLPTEMCVQLGAAEELRHNIRRGFEVMSKRIAEHAIRLVLETAIDRFAPEDTAYLFKTVSDNLVSLVLTGETDRIVISGPNGEKIEIPNFEEEKIPENKIIKLVDDLFQATVNLN